MRWILLIIGLAGCAHLNRQHYVHVETVVNAYSDPPPGALLKGRKLNFLSAKSDDIRYRSENRRIAGFCADAAQELGMNASVDMPCSDCLNVQINHIFKMTEHEGGTSTSCFFGQWGGGCSSRANDFTINNRMLTLSFFDGAKDKAVHKIDAYSAGSTTSVVEVSLEMCYAALRDFPGEVDDREYKVSAGLEAENLQRDLATSSVRD